MERGPGSPPLTAGIEQEIVDLYERESSGILRYAGVVAGNQETAHDALQEAFFRFFLCRTAGQQIRSPKAWLFRVARNYVLDQKKAGSRHEVGMESLLNVPCPAHPETAAASPIYCEDCCKLASRPGRSNASASGRKDLRYEEIASVLGLQAGTVGALLARAHGKIRKAVGDGVHKELRLR